MKNEALIGILTVTLAVGAFYFFTQRSVGQSVLTTNGEASAQPAPSDESTQTSPDLNTLLAGGSSYSDAQGLYTFLYPNDYILDDQDKVHIRIYKRGDTQRPQSEISDGVLVVFEAVNLEGKTLEELVDSRIQQATADGTAEVTQPKQTTIINNYSGYSYELRSLGTAKYVVLQKNPQSASAVIVSYLVSDPQQRGYQAEVDAVLATLELRN